MGHRSGLSGGREGTYPKHGVILVTGSPLIVAQNFSRTCQTVASFTRRLAERQFPSARADETASSTRRVQVLVIKRGLMIKVRPLGVTSPRRARSETTRETVSRHAPMEFAISC